VKDLRKLNISLMCKWWWTLEHETGLWQEIVRLKYAKDTHVCLIKPSSHDSPVWTDLLKIRHIYLKGREYELNDGRSISFWFDIWMGNTALCTSYPALYDLCLEQDKSVKEMADADWVLHFKINLPPVLRVQWYELAAKLNSVVLKDGRDEVKWKWSSSKHFTVRSVYQQLTKTDNGQSYQIIWKAKIPPENQDFCVDGCTMSNSN
jgi:hypothetical protein